MTPEELRNEGMWRAELMRERVAHIHTGYYGPQVWRNATHQARTASLPGELFVICVWPMMLTIKDVLAGIPTPGPLPTRIAYFVFTSLADQRRFLENEHFQSLIGADNERAG